MIVKCWKDSEIMKEKDKTDLGDSWVGIFKCNKCGEEILKQWSKLIYE